MAETTPAGRSRSWRRSAVSRDLQQTEAGAAKQSSTEALYDANFLPDGDEGSEEVLSWAASVSPNWESDGQQDEEEFVEEEHRSAFQPFRQLVKSTPSKSKRVKRAPKVRERSPQGTFADDNDSMERYKQKSQPSPFTCQVCGRMFRQDRQLENHMRIHTNERPYKCLTCNKCFRQEAHLTTHVRVHTGELPYKCEVCNRRFSQSSHLYRHRRTHSGDRPHACPHCSLRFILPNELRRHLPVHTGERRFTCYECGKAFKRAGHVDIHIRSVHLQLRPYECLFCGKAWAQKQHLHVHMRIHTGERPYWCDKCKRSFSSRSYSRKHVCPGRPVTAADVIEIAKAKRRQRVIEKKQQKQQVEKNLLEKQAAKCQDGDDEACEQAAISEDIDKEEEGCYGEDENEDDGFQQFELQDDPAAVGNGSHNDSSETTFPHGMTDEELAKWYQSHLNSYSSDSDEGQTAADNNDDPDWRP